MINKTSTILEDIQTLLGINDSLHDNFLNLYIRKARTLIKNYLKIKDAYDEWGIELIDATDSYPDAIVEYVIIQFNKRGNEGMKQFGQGSVSGTYDDALPESVKVLLPMPLVKMRR